MLGVLALVAFIIAVIFKLTSTHADMVIWLILAGDILLAAHVLWGWYGTRYGNRTVAP